MCMHSLCPWRRRLATWPGVSDGAGRCSLGHAHWLQLHAAIRHTAPAPAISTTALSSQTLVSEPLAVTLRLSTARKLEIRLVLLPQEPPAPFMRMGAFPQPVAARAEPGKASPSP